ncbi:MULTISPECIES: hypothetical protein [Pseudomonadaceae]|jgi:hypothetical protein|uniref:Uncharacterized protein n=1 Tax=Aquipseudomonas alcaligenes TaxID=43263 RepID=A0AA37CIQ1_AQUAC|nr:MULTISPECIES: hypothetical protein [Pseudomonas aeruginosa group]MDH2243804.1 hypothetical protein [Pseudomonas sp. GD03909]MBG4296684.1 hypothetical protein [Pseudomonas aeruginosa]MBH9458553.1 hypothetical protein [Pseudomonas aeruginosa]MBH9466011.1 hypothetical protein [Pseudomonas aeruginosa]MCT5234400.1 hypothetical protein [Pseudomonas aeruginosa]
MYFSKNKDINKLALKLLQLGWSYAKGRHYKLFPPNGCGMVIVPGTPGDCRAFQNFRRDVRQRLRGHAERYRHASQELMP